MQLFTTFQNDGPTPVSDADFLTYQRAFGNDGPSFDDLYYYWLSESHPDGARTLALRDMLRQDGDRKPTRHTNYHTTSQLGRLPVLLKDGKGANSASLRNRPKLVSELVGELLFAITHNRLYNGYRAYVEVNALIAILIPLVDEATGRLLLSHHSIWSPSSTSPQHTDEVLYFVIDRRYPAWLQAELWQHVQTACIQELSQRNDLAEYSRLRDVSSSPSAITAAQHLEQFIGRYSIDPDKKDFVPLNMFIQFMNDHLPESLSYNFLHEAAIIAPRIPDEEAALNYIRRHIMGLDLTDNAERSSLSRPFLYWLYGLAAHHVPMDDPLIPRIRELLNPATAPTEAKA